MAWTLRRDRRHVLVAVPIQSTLGRELLVEVVPSDRLRWAHVVDAVGGRRWGGAAAADVLSALPSTRVLGRLAASLPRTTAVLYGIVARRRASLGRLVGREARRRADEQLAAQMVATAAQLEARSRA